MLLPTLLELFTASYPEAMRMKRPILTSNYDFATSICGDAAEYFDPLSPLDIADSILRVSKNPDRYNELVSKGTQRLTTIGTATERAEQYIEICKQLVNNR